MTIRLDELPALEDGTLVRGVLNTCKSCGARFIARRGAAVCSEACRKRLERERKAARVD